MIRRALAIAVVFLFAAPARADDARAEQAGRDAVQAAQTDFATGKYDNAVARLRRALRACGQCGAPVRAQLLRDLGAIQVHTGDDDGGAASFAEALRLEPGAELTTRYDSVSVRAAWDAGKEEAEFASTPQPSGDFAHVPPPEGAVRTPLALYFEAPPEVAKVLVRYRSTAMRELGRLELTRVGKGWGGLLPCGEMTRGVVRYYVVGSDASGSPTATGGDAKHPYFVRIRTTAQPPSLPGQPTPEACPETAAPTPMPEHPAPVEEAPKPREGGGLVRLWIGVAGSIDLAVLPSATDACKSQGSPYYCTDPAGNDYPGDPKISFANGRAGNPGGGLTAGDVRVLAAVDYAVTGNVLAGARVGLVTRSYPGQAGRTFVPLHVEARGTYVFGDAPLAATGFAPLVMGALGLGRFDAPTTVQVVEQGVAGERPTIAWKTGGPFFLGLGGGARYAFSLRMAASAIVVARAALGGSGLFPSLAPEIALQYGF